MKSELHPQAVFRDLPGEIRRQHRDVREGLEHFRVLLRHLRAREVEDAFALHDVQELLEHRVCMPTTATQMHERDTSYSV